MTDIGDMIERGGDGPEWCQHRYDAAWQEMADLAKVHAENAALRAEVERLQVHEAFHAVAVQQRNEAWARLDRVISKFRSEVERLREERRWISVEERLPEFEVPVFCHAYGSTWIGCRSSDEDGECWCGLLELPWYHKKGRWVVDPEFGDYKPTHWHPFPQPLPAPPGEEE